MDTRRLGNLWPVSALTIGGGGLGQVWGTTSREETVATLRKAIDSGITLIDVAPSYGDGEAEEVVGDAFGGKLPDGVRISTKQHIGHIEPGEVGATFEAGLDASLERLKVPFVDLYLLHSQIVPKPDPDRATWTTPQSLYEDAIAPALDELVERGRIGAWGVTAIQFPDTLDGVFGGNPAPQVAQMVANVLDAPGDMRWPDQTSRPRELVQNARSNGLGVMGIRAVQAGALTDNIDRPLDSDHPAAVDFDRAAPFRALAAEMGEPAASLAHRYVLTMEGVDTVVLGVKNRAELDECLRAAERGRLTSDELATVDEVMASLRSP